MKIRRTISKDLELDKYYPEHLRGFSWKVLNENELNYSVLESSRNNLQECAIKSMKFHSRN